MTSVGKVFTAVRADVGGREWQPRKVRCRCVIFRTGCSENPQSFQPHFEEALGTTKLWFKFVLSIGAGLAFFGGVPHVFRTVLLSIALLLCIGRDIPLLCKALCNPEAAAANGCHHVASPSDAFARHFAGDDCDDNGPIATAYVNEEVRRSAPSPQAGLALLAARYQSAWLITAVRAHGGPGHPSSLEKPLETALRI
jgi:hypothetical protein